MRKHFVKTSNYRAFSEAVRAVEARGAAEAGMMLVHGLPGLGKSHIVHHWAAETGAVFLRANVDWTPRYALVELAKILQVDSRGTSQQIFTRLLDPIASSQLPIVIDEAEFTLSNKAASLEKIRDISDRAETTVVIIGMDKIQGAISSYGQISSRIARVVEFKPATLDDVASACTELAEIELETDLVSEIHRLSSGRMREVLNILTTIEHLAKTNGLKSVNLNHLQGVALTHDWRQQTPKGVRGGVRSGAEGARGTAGARGIGSAAGGKA